VTTTLEGLLPNGRFSAHVEHPRRPVHKTGRRDLMRPSPDR